MPGENGEPLRVDHDKDPSVIYVKYKSLYGSAAVYAKPVVKVEISVLSMDEPRTQGQIPVSHICDETGMKQVPVPSMLQTK